MVIKTMHQGHTDRLKVNCLSVAGYLIFCAGCSSLRPPDDLRDAAAGSPWNGDAQYFLGYGRADAGAEGEGVYRSGKMVMPVKAPSYPTPGAPSWINPPQ
jgi:hypothetical protein